MRNTYYINFLQNDVLKYMLHRVAVLGFGLLILIGWLLSGMLEATDREDLGRSQKFRILVDKVLMQQSEDRNQWKMTDQFVAEIAQAGFNVVVPRTGGDDFERVRHVAQHATKHGIYTMPWLRGTLHLYDKGSSYDKQRMVWPSGFSPTFYSPNMDKLWRRLTRLIVGYARISAEYPALIGVFLDFENYWPKGKPGFDTPSKSTAYDLSYDKKILGEFAEAMHIDIPELQPSQRYPWLVKNNLHDAFATFQIESWRTKCRTLRQQVDAINPNFQFFIYPNPANSLFIEKAACLEWSTEAAPVVIADWRTYGRPQGGTLSLRDSLMASQIKLKKSFNKNKHLLTEPYMYMSGIDPILPGTDPEFCARNAVMISEITDGYWVFYEGPVYNKPDHLAYWRWFLKANQAIVAGRYKFWQEESKEIDLSR